MCISNRFSLPPPPFIQGLPDEHGRVEIFQIHTAQMTKHKKIDPAVNLEELAKRTRNFTGAEIESVVRSAQATAMNRLIEVRYNCLYYFLRSSC